MADITRHIGLSLGADLCWPLCFEEIVSRLNPSITIGGDTTRFNIERLTIEPFDLMQPCKYDVVLDRLTHWYHTSREWIKKAILLDDLYVLNNPWALQSMEKHTSYAAMMKLGLPVPTTWVVPPKEYEPSSDLQPTLERYARMFDVREIGEKIGYPLFIKPYDGGAWVGVNRIENGDELQEAYEASGRRVMHLQKAVEPHDLFVRCVGVGPQTRMVKYDPGAPLHERYTVDFDFLSNDEAQTLRQMTMTINAYFGWDFNSCEALRSPDGVFHPIDFANACPDSQVTSLHYHFPWLVKSLIRWSIFCAATNRPMRKTPDWTPFEEIAAEGGTLQERLKRYAAVADERLETERFEDFCNTHLADLDEITWEYFGSDHARDTIRAKVESLFPEHEVDQFTDHFWGLIQFWRKTEADRIGSNPVVA